MAREHTPAVSRGRFGWRFYCATHKHYRTANSFRLAWGAVDEHWAQFHTGLSPAEQEEWDRAVAILAQHPAVVDNALLKTDHAMVTSDYVERSLARDEEIDLRPEWEGQPLYSHEFSPALFTPHLCVECGGGRDWTLDGNRVHPDD